MTTKRFHITDNGPKPCKANKRPCKYGASQEHYKTEAAAQAAFEKRQATLPKPLEKQGDLAPNRILALYEGEKRSVRHEKYSQSLDSYRERGGEEAPGSVHKRTLARVARKANMTVEEVQKRLIQGQADKFHQSFEEAKAHSLAEREARAEGAKLRTALVKRMRQEEEELLLSLERKSKLLDELPQDDPRVDEGREEILHLLSDEELQKRWRRLNESFER